MKPAFVMLALFALTACGPEPSTDAVEALAVYPVRLKAVRQQCQVDRTLVGEAACQDAAEAFRRRFLTGAAGPDEHPAPAEPLPIPPSFDEPGGDEEGDPPAEVSP